MVRRKIVLVPVAVLLLATVLVVFRGLSDDYRVQLTMNNAASLHQGSPVFVDGQRSGSVTSITVEDGKAVVDVSLSGDHAPLHAGTNAAIRWRAVLGERQIDLTPGPAENAEIPSGGMVPVSVDQVDVDDLLAALDEETREHVAGLVQRLDSTLDDSADDLNESLRTAGPAFEQLGEVIRAVGDDGAAIRAVVTDLREVVQPMAERDDQLNAIVDDLTAVTGVVAAHEQALSQGLEQLPTTLAEADLTLAQVAPAVAEARPLLRDLRPVAGRLASVSENLEPVLVDLRSAVSSLRPVIDSTSELLVTAPRLLDGAQAVLPDLNSTVDALNPAVAFLRPYTPDLVAWLTNWGSGFSAYDSQGNYAASIVRVGVSSINENPGIPLTMNVDPRPAPGKAAGTPWVDANGSGLR